MDTIPKMEQLQHLLRSGVCFYGFKLCEGKSKSSMKLYLQDIFKHRSASVSLAFVVAIEVKQSQRWRQRFAKTSHMFPILTASRV